MPTREIELTGVVRREIVNKGSKSEYEAVVLATPDGSTYALTQPNANPFEPGDLDRLVGHSIETRGLLTDQTLSMRQWRITD